MELYLCVFNRAIHAIPRVAYAKIEMTEAWGASAAAAAAAAATCMHS